LCSGSLTCGGKRMRLMDKGPVFHPAFTFNLIIC
jgi:hypothetical protein